MPRNIIVTKDGSPTISVPEWGVAYHSIHGALTESLHVFIRAGWDEACRIHTGSPLRLFEMGFGTGLNALLTLIEAEKSGRSVFYQTVETDPLNPGELDRLDYTDRLGRPELKKIWDVWHRGNEQELLQYSQGFILEKHRQDLRSFRPEQKFHLVYYDAFAPNAQPELWTMAIFEQLHQMMVPGGILVTYCAKGEVRRSMQAAGFTVEKLPGPPGKREMLRARRK